MIAIKAHNRPLAVALLVSTLFHLSMVSVFSVVLWFPRPELRYYSIEIVKELSKPAPDRRGRDVLRMPSVDRPLALEDEATLAAADARLSLGPLPAIELPRLEFADLDRLRIREQSLQIRSRFEDWAAPEPQDSWARFTREMRDLGGLVSRLKSSLRTEDEEAPQQVSRPAPGFAAYIEWLSEPKDRELLFSPPIRALWNVDPAQLDGPIALVFEVDPQGKVTEVQIPIEDEAGIITSVGGALLQYRFAPLGLDAKHPQRGTFLVTAAPEAP